MRKLFGVSIILISCGETKFNSGQRPPTPPQCSTEAVNPHLLFLTDNSSSMLQNECPGNFDKIGENQFRCRVSQTIREKAVLEVSDRLSKLGGDASTRTPSTIKIASFPAVGKVDGFDLQTPAWESLDGVSAKVQKAMQFALQPFGGTPYADALRAAEIAFADLAPSNAKRLALFLTDGEPTDRDPNQIVQLTEALKAKGVSIGVVIVSQKGEVERLIEHRAYLLRQNYTPDAISMIIGSNGQPTVARRMVSGPDFYQQVDQMAGITDAMTKMVYASQVCR